MKPLQTGLIGPLNQGFVISKNKQTKTGHGNFLSTLIDVSSLQQVAI